MKLVQRHAEALNGDKGDPVERKRNKTMAGYGLKPNNKGKCTKH